MIGLMDSPLSGGGGPELTTSATGQTSGTATTGVWITGGGLSTAFMLVAGAVVVVLAVKLLRS